MPRRPAANSPLKLVPPRHDPEPTPPMPADLGAPGRALWKAITADYLITDSGEVAILEQACRSIDQAEACRVRIAEEGLLAGERGHPLLRHETANLAAGVRFLEKLGVTDAPVRKPGRPGGGAHVGIA